MPETQIAPDFEIEMPAIPVPAREGESQAMLSMEDGRRKESIVAELRAELKRLEGTAAGEAAMKYAGSKSARKRQRILRAKVEELKKSTFRRDDRWDGPCVPATVVNLNPLELKLYGELQRWTIPAAGDGKKPPEQSVKFVFKGRDFSASYMTLTEPHVWPVVTGVQNDNLAGFDATQIEARYIPPIGLAHQFFSHYVFGAHDAQSMGGVIIFEGDINTLDKARMQRSGGHIWVPKASTTLDGTGEVVYTLEKEKFSDVLEAALTMQREYAEQIIAQGHSYATSQADLIRNQLTKYHILWHNWAMDRGYKTEAEPWASERLEDSPSIEAVFCPDCHQRQENPNQYFCKNCNAPFDACKAYLAGKTVSPDRLAVYDADSKEFQLIVAETKRRRANIAMLELPGDEPEKKAKK
jgi:hypothetical protein